MIRLSGYEPYRDIEIVETGLRPGEKLYEELLIAGRDLEKTVNGMIFVEHQPPVTPEELERKLTLLNDALEKTMRTEDSSCIRQVLHRVVPTFHEPEEVNACQGETWKSQRRKRFLPDPLYFIILRKCRYGFYRDEKLPPLNRRSGSPPPPCMGRSLHT